MRSLALVIIAGSVLGACAPTGEVGQGGGSASAARQCFDPEWATSYQQGGDRTIYVRDRTSGPTYELQSIGFCRDIDFASGLGLQADVGRTLCVGDRGRLGVSDVVNPTQVCRVRVVRQLTMAEAEALPRR